MTNNQVDKKEFWKNRIAEAETLNELRLSVFNTSRQDWRDINEAHEAILKQFYEPGMKVLDAGCGYGRLSQWIQPEDYIGIDFSEDFIEKAEELYPNNTFLVGDLKDLSPFQDNAFDLAVCISIKGMITRELGHQTWNRMKQELKRVSKNVLILEYGDKVTYEFI